MSKQSEKIIAEFSELYKQVHGEEPSIEIFKGGQYTVNGTEKLRLKDIKVMISDLTAALETQTSNDAPAQAAAVSQHQASLTVADLRILLEALSLAANRGAFQLEEFAQIGVVASKLKGLLMSVDRSNAEQSKEQEQEEQEETGE
tara:strand:+ start:276 stop:710 length:435 start_codon:yes stop_codon:yes gene_type:complete